MPKVLRSIGLSGQIQTAYAERLNLTIRHTVAAQRRKTWALARGVRTLRWRVALAVLAARLKERADQNMDGGIIRDYRQAAV